MWHVIKNHKSSIFHVILLLMKNWVLLKCTTIIESNLPDISAQYIPVNSICERLIQLKKHHMDTGNFVISKRAN